jgi:hypothetical protein
VADAPWKPLGLAGQDLGPLRRDASYPRGLSDGTKHPSYFTACPSPWESVCGDEQQLRSCSNSASSPILQFFSPRAEVQPSVEVH